MCHYRLSVLLMSLQVLGTLSMAAMNRSTAKRSAQLCQTMLHGVSSPNILLDYLPTSTPAQQQLAAERPELPPSTADSSMLSQVMHINV